MILSAAKVPEPLHPSPVCLRLTTECRSQAIGLFQQRYLGLQSFKKNPGLLAQGLEEQSRCQG